MKNTSYIGEGPRVPSGFLKGLRDISPNLCVVWERRRGRWLIATPAPMRLFRSGYVVERVIEKNNEYYPLNDSVLTALRMTIQRQDASDTLDHLLQEIDADKAKREAEAAKMFEDGSKALEKKAKDLTTKKHFT